MQLSEDKIPNILFTYIILTVLPLFLENYSFFTFLARGTNLYSVYIYFLSLMLFLLLFKLNDFKINKNSLFLVYFITLSYVISFFSGLKVGFEFSIILKTVFLSIITFTIICTYKAFYLTEEGLTNFMKKILLFVIFASIFNLLINLDLLFYGTSSFFNKKQFASFFGNRNTFGMLLTVGIISNIFLLFKEKKIIYLPVFLLLYWNVILTDSTNSLLTSIIFLIIFSMLIFRKKLIKKISFYFLGIALILFLYYKGFFDGVLSFIQEDDLTEFSGRPEIWQAGLNTFIDNPLFGVGIGKSEHILSSSGLEVNQFHNEFIEILVSGGIILLIIYLVLGLFLFIKLIELYSINKLIGSTFLAAFFSLVFSMFFESYGFFGIGFYSGIISIFYLFIPLIIINAHIGNKKWSEFR